MSHREQECGEMEKPRIRNLIAHRGEEDGAIRDVASVLAGLMTYYVHEKHISRKLEEFGPFGPFMRALRATTPRPNGPGAAALGEVYQLIERLRPKWSGLTAYQCYCVYYELIIERKLDARTAFCGDLFDSLAEQPEIGVVIDWLDTPGTPSDPNDRVHGQADKLLVVLLDCLVDPVKDALEIYLKHHCEGGLCAREFTDWATSASLLGDDQPAISNARQRHAQQIALFLLGLRILEGYKGQTLLEWARRGWTSVDKRRKRPVRNMKAVVNQVLLGPSITGKADRRARGAIIAGLLHWYFKSVVGLPFHGGIL